MKVSVTTIDVAELDVDLLLVPIAEESASAVLTALGQQVGETIARAEADFAGKAGQTVLLYPPKAQARRLGLIGLGPQVAVDAERLRVTAADGAALAERTRAETVALAVPAGLVDTETACQALVEGFMLGSYRFLEYKTPEEDVFEGTQRLVLQTTEKDKAGRQGSERGRILAESARTARDLVNLSPNDKTAEMLAKAIEKSAKRYGYQASVWDKKLIEEEGMRGLLAVNKGSVDPPTFTVMTWKPENPLNKRPVVLVGKGVVFDTGGLSLKPTKDSMDAMKSDMGGAAAVIGAMEAIARLALPLHVVALVPATDNRPGLQAYVPGDVIRMHSGKTVEVLNTDAEGRMLLADALSYARTYRPELVIDLATLTGAAIIALGKDVAAIMTNETEGAADRLERMEAAGQASGEWVHRLPMYKTYGKLIESDVADIKNVGGREAGSITAAKFLEHFVDYPWIHIDIAGPSFLRQPKPYRPVGGTGFGVRLLVAFLRSYGRSVKR